MIRRHGRSTYAWLLVAVAGGCVTAPDPDEAAATAQLTGTTYYVSSSLGNDANAGTSSSAPWQSIDRVDSHPGGFHPGDKILFRAGDRWNTQWGNVVQLHPQGTGDPTTNCGTGVIQIDKYDVGPKPAIVGGGAPQAAVYLKDQSCWEIRNLDVSNQAPSPGGEYVGIKAENSQPNVARHIYIANNTVHDVNGIVNGFYASNAGIAVTADMNTQNPCPNWPNACPANPTWDDVVIENNTINNVDRIGIYVGLNFQAPGSDGHAWTLFQRINHVTIRGNTLTHIGADGILTLVTRNVLVERNTVADSGTRVIDPAGCNACTPNSTAFANCNSAGIWTAVTDSSVLQYNEVYNYAIPRPGGAHQCDGTAFDSDIGTTNQIIQYNYSHNNWGGMLLTCEDPDAPTGSLTISGQVVRYNVSYNDPSGAFTYACGNGSLPLGPVPSKIHNNTIVTAGGLSAMFYTQAGIIEGTASIFNNVFYARSGAALFTPFSQSGIFHANTYVGTLTGTPSDPSAQTCAPAAGTCPPLLVQPAAAGVGLASVDGLKLAAGSPALSSGENPIGSSLGPLDFWSNAVPAPPGVVNRGAYQGAGIAPGPTDVALGATATLVPNTSYEGEGWGAAKVTDGRRDSTYIFSEGITTQAYGSPNNTVDLIIQLSAIRTFSTVVLFPRNDDGRVGQGFPSDFTIDVWNGLTWIPRVVRTSYPTPGNQGQSFSWPADRTDRIRIHATKLGPVAGLGYYLQLAEVEVY